MGLATGLLNGRDLKIWFHFSLIMICGIFCCISLPYGWTASQKDLTDFQSLSLVRTVSFVETKVHSFIKGLVISYQNFNFSQFKVSLLLPIFCDLQWPFLLLTAPPHHLAACSSSRVSTRRETSMEWRLTIFLHHQFVLLAILS